MVAAQRQLLAPRRTDAAPSAEPPQLTLVQPGRASQALPFPGTGGVYAGGRLNWPVIGGIALLHAALVAMLLTTGIIEVRMPTARPIVVDLVEPEPEQAVPEPAAPELALDPVQPQIFAPEVIVEVPAPVPSPIMTTTMPTPPAMQAAAAAPQAVAPVKAPQAAAITAPDFAADQLNNPGPRYPSLSRRNREEGVVTLKVLVSIEGRAQQLLIEESSGHERLDEAALATVRKWRFTPAMQAGKAVAAWVLVPVTFSLSRQ